MKMFLITILIFSLAILFCQNKVGTVKGKVVDADSNFIMKSATIFLVEKTLADSIAQNKNYKPTNVPVYGNVVDKNGNYEIKNVPSGKYVIKCYLLGYKMEMDIIELEENYIEKIKDFYLKVQKYRMY